MHLQRNGNQNQCDPGLGHPTGCAFTTATRYALEIRFIFSSGGKRQRGDLYGQWMCESGKVLWQDRRIAKATFVFGPTRS